jgi:hypothetical protein
LKKDEGKFLDVEHHCIVK